MSFDRVRGQGAAVERLRAALKTERLSHAYLITGAPGVGKRTLARELVRAVLCEKKKDDACDRCRSCRALDSGNSWDCSILTVEDGKGNARPVDDSDREIKVASVRTMERELSVKVAEGRARAVLIPGAERMNEEAQNALLKTLEEPAGSRLLVLTSSRPEALLPTVISRLARLRLRPLSAEEIADYLTVEEKVSPAAARELAAAADGSIGAALSADLEEVRATREFARRELASADSGMPLPLADRIMEFARERSGSGKGLEPLRRGLLGLFRAAIRAYRQQLLAALAAPEPETGHQRRCLEALLRAEKAIRSYASPDLVCRVLAGELRGN